MSPTDAWLLAFDHLPVAGLLLDTDGTILAINAAFCRIIGKEARDLAGRPAGAVMPPGSDDLAALLAASRRPGEVVHELQVSGTEGVRTLECVMSLLPPGGDRSQVVQLFGIDVTARSQAVQSSAQQRLESLGIVAGGIAHDFNNLLVGVLAEASAAREDLTLSEPGREALRRIEASARRMAQLTRQMLAYAGRGQFVTTRVDPDEMLRELGEQLARVVRPDLKLVVDPGAGAVVVDADQGLLRQVMVNLTVNASDAGGTEVTVATRIVVRQNASWWQLEVSDDGAGIEPQTMSRIFEPFFSTKRDRHGLGLSAVHGIVRRLGGDIEVDSRPGQGARFRVRLPLVLGAEATPRITDGQMPISRLEGLRVLVADDEPSVRATVRRLLERRGAGVAVAVDGEEAEAKLREETFDLVILDVSMPGRSGFDVLQASRLLHPGLPVILMSGYTERLRGEGGEEEPDAFLEKPFSAKALDEAINDVMRRKR